MWGMVRQHLQLLLLLLCDLCAGRFVDVYPDDITVGDRLILPEISDDPMERVEDRRDSEAIRSLLLPQKRSNSHYSTRIREGGGGGGPSYPVSHLEEELKRRRQREEALEKLIELCEEAGQVKKVNLTNMLDLLLYQTFSKRFAAGNWPKQETRKRRPLNQKAMDPGMNSLQASLSRCLAENNILEAPRSRLKKPANLLRFG